MQPKKSTIVDFARRTDALASRLGVRLGDLPSVLGLSRASLFNYRSGKARITDKAWRKLEHAERQAGISKSLLEQLQTSKEDATQLLKSASLSEVLDLLPEEQRLRLAQQAYEMHIDALEAQLRLFFLDAQALAGLVKSKKRSSRRDIVFFANKIETSFRRSTAAWESLARELRRALDLEPQLLSEQVRAKRPKPAP